MKNFIETRSKEIEKFLNNIKKGTDMKNLTFENDRFNLLKIKETIQQLNNYKESTELDIERIKSILTFYEEENIHMTKEKDLVTNLDIVLQRLVKHSYDVEELIADAVKEETTECKLELEQF